MYNSAVGCSWTQDLSFDVLVAQRVVRDDMAWLAQVALRACFLPTLKGLWLLLSSLPPRVPGSAAGRP